MTAPPPTIDYTIGTFGEPAQCPPPPGQTMCVHLDYTQWMRGIVAEQASYIRALEKRVQSLTAQLTDAHRRLRGDPYTPSGGAT